MCVLGVCLMAWCVPGVVLCVRVWLLCVVGVVAGFVGRPLFGVGRA